MIVDAPRCGGERAYRATAKDHLRSQTHTLEVKNMRILLCRRVPTQTGVSGGTRSPIANPTAYRNDSCSQTDELPTDVVSSRVICIRFCLLTRTTQS
jgi:hypothetical protein